MVPLNVLVISARRPVKLLLVRRTSLSTSFDILSREPGCGKPKAFRFSCKDEKSSVARCTMALDVMKSNGELDFSVMMEKSVTRQKGEDGAGERRKWSWLNYTETPSSREARAKGMEMKR